MLVPVYDILNCGPRHRFSANGKLVHNSFSLNQENLPRVCGKLSDALRNSLIAPPGHKVVVADLSGIELRVNHFLWKVPSSMALFEADPEKADLYKDFASKLYNVPASEVSKPQRQIGKIAHLGLGFSAGVNTFVRIAKMMGGVDITDEESQLVVSQWRDAYAEIVNGWKKCSASFRAIAHGVKFDIDPWGLIHTDKEGYVLPSGRKIRYPNIRQVPGYDGKSSWKYGDGRNETFLTGGKAVENIVQALARDILMDNALLISKKYPIVHTVHDEIVTIVPDSEAETALAYMFSVMRTPPTWFPALKLWAEGAYGDSYGSCK